MSHRNRSTGLPDADDLRLFSEGRHERLWEVLGSHPTVHDGVDGTAFAVWAPRARAVSVVGSWSGWAGGFGLEPTGAGVWLGFAPGVPAGTHYKYEVHGADGTTTLRGDPMAQYAEHSGGMASIVFDSDHEWGDSDWMQRRRLVDPVADRLSIYEVHVGSWRRDHDDKFLGYRDLAPPLADHVAELGFTHVELMPVAEHPYYPSWGYQVTGFYAPTSRYGDPDDFRWFVDHLHQRGIGVIVDWVPAHFPQDPGALVRFDGAPLYEHDDPQRAEHPDWGTLVFDHGRPEVRDYLVANALYWLGELHVDGLRVDAVASMIYRDYSRGPGQWSSNVHGGNEDLEAVAFLQELNTVVHRVHPGVLTIAEESTAWEGVSQPAEAGGLGFTHKWNMGWMHDTLGYWATEPDWRRDRHTQLTFGISYAWAEHFVLPLSHDEVVHLKKPLLGKMPGSDDRDRFANLRALYAWMWAHPGKQLLFMGSELAERREWSQDRELDWALLDDPRHAGVCRLLAELNRAQAERPELHAVDGDPDSFGWLSVDDSDSSVFAFERSVPGRLDVLVCVANLSAVERPGYRLGLPRAGSWRELLNTADERFVAPGEGSVPSELRHSEPIPWQRRGQSVAVDLPPLTVIYLVPE